MTTVPPMPKVYYHEPNKPMLYVALGELESLAAWGNQGWAKAQELDASLAEQSEALEGYRETSADRIEQVEELTAKLEETQRDSMSALDLVSRIRFALGDNGKMIQDELLDYCRELVASKARLGEAERDYQNEMGETDALKLRLVASSVSDAKHRAQATALAEALERLLAGLDSTTWSSWQTTARLQSAWHDAQGVLTTFREGR